MIIMDMVLVTETAMAVMGILDMTMKIEILKQP